MIEQDVDLSYQTNVEAPPEPKPVLGIVDAVAIIVGIVIGAGIFRTPSLVASNTATEAIFLSAWLLGGIISLVGALCYAELTSAFPNTGGDYHFLHKAYGKRVAFLFAWARLSVIQTGSIALLAFIFGDYMTQIFSLGPYSSVIYAALVVISLTTINILGVSFGTGAQKLFTAFEVGGILLVIICGLLLAPGSMPAPPAGAENASGVTTTSMGLAMVIVLLTFGGWNEAAYISAELRSGKKQMAKALIISIIIITAVYLLISVTYLKVLGLSGMARSEAVAVDLIQVTLGRSGALLIAVLVAISALTSANATIFTGARTNYAMGKDFHIFAGLAKWNRKTSAPVNAFIAQGVISLILVCLGFITRNGFETIIEYTAPVFWFFFLLTGLSLFILRRKEPDVKRPFRVPLYPVTPIVFCFTSGYLLYSSLMYTGMGAFVGIGVLFAGILIFPILNKPKDL
ncbi:MAG TPA: amino acid permease [Sphingobacteriaceae bacterium]